MIERTQTSTGLRVTVDIINSAYETGRKAADHLKTNMKIMLDSIFPKWNYTISPKAGS